MENFMKEIVIVQYEKYTTKGWVVENGEFMAWGVNYEELNNGVGNYSVALIKQNDGKIIEVIPSKVVFKAKKIRTTKSVMGYVQNHLSLK